MPSRGGGRHEVRARAPLVSKVPTTKAVRPTSAADRHGRMSAGSCIGFCRAAGFGARRLRASSADLPAATSGWQRTVRKAGTAGQLRPLRPRRPARSTRRPRATRSAHARRPRRFLLRLVLAMPADAEQALLQRRGRRPARAPASSRSMRPLTMIADAAPRREVPRRSSARSAGPRSRPPRRAARSICSTCSTMIGASPSVGSSMTSSCGLPSSARQIASICCSPPESCAPPLRRRSASAREGLVDALDRPRSRLAAAAGEPQMLVDA